MLHGIRKQREYRISANKPSPHSNTFPWIDCETLFPIICEQKQNKIPKFF